MDLSSLNPQQVEAVNTTEGPLLILAGAGSGKTRVITVRIAYLIQEKGVAPHNILAVTFTNKAAGEMQNRVKELLKGERLNSFPLISTFHSLCVRILRQDIEALGEGYKKSFTIYDTDDTQKVIKARIMDAGYDEKQIVPRVVRSAISAAKNRGEDVELFASKVEHTDEKRAAAARIFRMYEERLKLANALDFDDLLIKTVKLLRTSDEVRAKYNDRYKYILVDEYQDTNTAQYMWLRLLAQRPRPSSPLAGEVPAERAEGGGSASLSVQASPPPPDPSGHPPRKGEGNWRPPAEGRGGDRLARHGKPRRVDREDRHELEVAVHAAPVT